MSVGATPSDPGPQCAVAEPRESEMVADTVRDVLRDLERKLRVAERLLDLERARCEDLTRERNDAQAECYRVQRNLGYR